MKLPPKSYFAALCIAGQSTFADTVWSADLGDGNYCNPVLYADYSDPDVVRHGDVYWMTASSFGHVPGLPILHSRDLVNWTLVNHALPRLYPDSHYSRPQHGNGVWAPCLRFHNGRFWIFYGDPDFGIYVLSAEDPAGEWTKPYLLKPGKGMIDPTPLWDKDGRAWLLHAWARSRAGFNNVLTLNEISPDALMVLDEGKVVIDGNALDGWRTLEGPKFYKRDGWYWVFAPAGGVAEGYQAVFRSRSIDGPYEERIVLEQGGTDINGPHQGGWVEAPAGEHWFLHFQEKLPHGRIVHLQPMRWQADGWPVMGSDPDGNGTGEPVRVHPKPQLAQQPQTSPDTTDTFDGDALGRQWQWQANPQHGWADLQARPGSLTLRCVPRPDGYSLWNAPNLLMQKFPAPAFEVTTQLDFAAAAVGDEAGLVVFGYNYSWIGLQRSESGWQIVLRTCLSANDGGQESTVQTILIEQSSAELRMRFTPDGHCQFAYRLNEGAFTDLGAPFAARESRWVGAKVGLFASSPQDSQRQSSHAVFEEFIFSSR